jgi:hypothetical protein
MRSLSIGPNERVQEQYLTVRFGSKREQPRSGGLDTYRNDMDRTNLIKRMQPEVHVRYMAVSVSNHNPLGVSNHNPSSMSKHDP